MHALNLVVLGPASAGKSALLGALQQAAQSKGAAVDGTVVDVTGELEKLRRTSLEKYHPTKTAVVAYPVARQFGGREEAALLLDTSGVEGAAVLAGQEDLAGRGAVPKALADADGVLLAVDIASATDWKQQYTQFVKFLELWQAQRGKTAKVGGLPVFLVLTKCDKIAREGESFSQWVQKVEETKRKVGEQFRKGLESSRGRSFGRVDLRVWATAAKRPVGDKTGRQGEPYQVAELFSQLFDAAAAYRGRIDRSSQTLQGALVGIGGIAVLLLLLVGWYYVTEPTPELAQLESKVASLLTGSDENVAERVREPLEDRFKELSEIKADKAFGQLSSDDRDRIAETERLLLAYQALSAEYQKSVANPRLVQSEKQLAAIDVALAKFDDKLAKWPDTRLAKRHETFKAETKALRQAIDAEIGWMHEQKAAGVKLYERGGGVIAKTVDAKTREKWFRDVLDYDFAGKRHKSNDRVAGTTIPYRVVYDIDSVKAAERAWTREKARLKDLRDGALDN